MNVTKDRDNSSSQFPVQNTNLFCKDVSHVDPEANIPSNKEMNIIKYQQPNHNNQPENVTSPVYAENSSEEPQRKIPDFIDLPEQERIFRIGFVRKVYGILIIQLVLTFGIVCLSFIKKVRDFLYEHFIILYIVLGVSVVLLGFLLCGRKIAKKVPLNYILFFVWTLLESYLLATLASCYDYEVVISGIGVAVGLSVGITVYAMLIINNYMFCPGLSAGLGGVVIFFLIFGCIFGKWAYTAYCGCGIFVLSLYIIYDTMLILGEFQLRYSIDDYIIAAISMYVDIVNIFLSLIGMMGGNRR